MVVDTEDEVVESDEGNNRSTVQVTLDGAPLLPNLVVDGWGYDADYDYVYYYIEVANLGDSASSSSSRRAACTAGAGCSSTATTTSKRVEWDNVVGTLTVSW